MLPSRPSVRRLGVCDRAEPRCMPPPPPAAAPRRIRGDVYLYEFMYVYTYMLRPH